MPRSPAFSLKQQRCQRCGLCETLNRHSFLYGNDPARTDGRVIRGQRVFCSNRGQRGGCGGTYSIFLAEVLPRHTLRATVLWKLLCQLMAGASIKAAAEALNSAAALETVYHLIGRLRRRLDAVRSWVSRKQSACPSNQSDPLLQTAEHLQGVFTGTACPPVEFQLAFQRPLMG